MLTTGSALLIASLGAACSSSEGGRTIDGGHQADGGGDDGAASAGDGSPSADGSTGADGSSAGDDGSPPGDANAAGDGSDGGHPSAHSLNLGTAQNYVILAMSGISSVPTSAITGNLGISPAAATYLTGFSLSVDATGLFATSTQVTGKVYAPGYAQPTPANLTTAVGDMQAAFTDAAGRAPRVTELGGGNIGGMTLAPGVYRWSTGLLVPTSVTLDGGPGDVWIFQIAQDLTVSNAAAVVLAGGAVPKNVFWQVAGAASLGTTARFEGIILGKTAITLGTGASVHGRLLAQTAVSIDSSTVVEP